MIGIRDVSRRYGSRIALGGVSFEVAPGRITGLLGANGAGKSTLIRVCAGLQAPDTGAVSIGGHDLWTAPIAARRELGYMAEEPSFHEELSALEYLSFLASLRALDPKESAGEARRLLGRFGLMDRAGEPVERYSHGMRKKLSFIAAALHKPRALLCDEALEGFDLEASIAAREELLALAAGGTAVLFASHVAAELERLCDTIVLLHRGCVVRTLARADWGGSSPEPSVLERAFLDVARTSPSPESS